MFLFFAAHIRDPGNIPHTVHNLRIHVRDINVHPANPALARKMMNDAVANAQPQMMENTRNSVISVGDYDLQLSSKWTIEIDLKYCKHVIYMY